jgi:uncharacterized membrane protein
MTQKWKVLLAFTGIFVAGAVAGGIVALRVGADASVEPTPSTASAPPPSKTTVVSPDNFKMEQMKRFISQLGLSSDQSAKIQPIITITGDRLKKLSQDSATATKGLLEDMDKEVGALLNDVQRKKLADIQKQRQERFNRQNHPPGPPRRGGGPDGDHAGGSASKAPPWSSSPAPADSAPAP